MPQMSTFQILHAHFLIFFEKKKNRTKKRKKQKTNENQEKETRKWYTCEKG